MSKIISFKKTKKEVLDMSMADYILDLVDDLRSRLDDAEEKIKEYKEVIEDMNAMLNERY